MAQVPMSVGVTVDLSAVESLLDSLKHAMTDLTPVFRGPIDASVTNFFRAQFDTEGKTGGTPWARLSPVTIAMKEGNGRGRAGADTVGRDTNRLWASLTKSGAPMGIRVITPKEYRRGTRVHYARWFHEGYTQRSIFGRAFRQGSLKVPPRPLVPESFPAPIVRAWEGMIARHVVGS